MKFNDALFPEGEEWGYHDLQIDAWGQGGVEQLVGLSWEIFSWNILCIWCGNNRGREQRRSKWILDRRVNIYESFNPIRCSKFRLWYQEAKQRRISSFSDFQEETSLLQLCMSIPLWNSNMWIDVWSFHGGEDDDVLLGFGAKDEDSMFLRNVGICMRRGLNVAATSERWLQNYTW
jgi:hypothetical protein